MSGGRYGPRKTPERRCMPIELWPADDRWRWELSCTSTSILEDVGGEMEHLAPISQSKTAKGWGRFLTFLTITEPSALLLPAEERPPPAESKPMFVRWRRWVIIRRPFCAACKRSKTRYVSLHRMMILRL